MTKHMPHILCIETATEVCSVAVFEGENLLYERCNDEGYMHAETLHPFIRDCMEEASLSFDALDAVAVSMGPGSYTGLRIGLSAAQGLCLGLDLPLLGIHTLESLADACFQECPEATLVAPMIDARRMEVYTAVFDRDMNEQVDPRTLILEEDSLISFRTNKQALYVNGNGCRKWKELHPKYVVWRDELKCSARHLIRRALKYRAVNREIAPQELKPIYLKSPNITRPQQTSE